MAATKKNTCNEFQSIKSGTGVAYTRRGLKNIFKKYTDGKPILEKLLLMCNTVMATGSESELLQFFTSNEQTDRHDGIVVIQGTFGEFSLCEFQQREPKDFFEYRLYTRDKVDKDGNVLFSRHVGGKEYCMKETIGEVRRAPYRRWDTTATGTTALLLGLHEINSKVAITPDDSFEHFPRMKPIGGVLPPSLQPGASDRQIDLYNNMVLELV